MTTFAFAARPARLRARRDRTVRTTAAPNADTSYIPAGTADLWKMAKPQFGR